MASGVNEVFINIPRAPRNLISETQVLLSDGGRFRFTRFQPSDASTQCHSEMLQVSHLVGYSPTESFFLGINFTTRDGYDVPIRSTRLV